MSTNRTDGENYFMTMLGKNVFYLSYLDGADVELEKVEEVVEKGFELHGEDPFYSIIDLRDNFASMSPEGKKFLANQTKLNELRICEAVMVNTLAMKLIISGYYRLHKPSWPIKVLRKNDELFEWLETHHVDVKDLSLLKEFLAEKQAKKVE